MDFKPFIARVAAVILLAVSIAGAQVSPAGRGTSPLISAGAGVSSFDVDYGNGRMLGVTAWIDVNPPMPRLLDGLGVEIEGRDISFDRQVQPSNFRQDTIGGGPIYTWHRYRNFLPYGKFMIDFAGIDFHSSSPTYNHDTRTAYAPGVGFEYRLHRNIWARAEYEYQWWQPIFSATKRLDPQGFTVGVMYGLPPFHSH